MTRAAAPTATVRATTGAAWWLAPIVVATVAGFASSFSKRPHTLDVAHAAHGMLALGWSVLLVSQAFLADTRRREWHRISAMLGIIFAIGLVATSVPMLSAIATAAIANNNFRPTGYGLLALDVLLLALFVALVAVAVAWVRRPAVHSRVMAATGLLALPAGLGRGYMALFGVGPLTASHLALGTAHAMLVGLIVRDRRAMQMEPVYPATIVTLLAIQVSFPLMARAPWFDTLARTLVGSP